MIRLGYDRNAKHITTQNSSRIISIYLLLLWRVNVLRDFTSGESDNPFELCVLSQDSR